VVKPVDDRLIKLAFNHACAKSGVGPLVESLTDSENLLRSAICTLEGTLRKLAKGLTSEQKSALFDSLAKAHPGLDFSSTKTLLGL
jgi:hypothetical protein